jgi:hypothetical protein
LLLVKNFFAAPIILIHEGDCFSMLIDKARSDVAREENNFFASELRNRAIGGIDGAIKSANSALID